MSIWFEKPDPEALNKLHEGCAVAHLGISVTEVGDDYLTGTMPVDARSMQPYGLLHGGATLLLVETLSSAASYACIDINQYYCVGIEVNANHISSASSGVVTCTTQAIHIGNRTHVWESKVTQDERLISVARLTVSVGKKR